MGCCTTKEPHELVPADQKPKPRGAEPEESAVLLVETPWDAEDELELQKGEAAQAGKNFEEIPTLSTDGLLEQKIENKPPEQKPADQKPAVEQKPVAAEQKPITAIATAQKHAVAAEQKPITANVEDVSAKQKPTTVSTEHKDAKQKPTTVEQEPSEQKPTIAINEQKLAAEEPAAEQKEATIVKNQNIEEMFEQKAKESTDLSTSTREINAPVLDGLKPEIADSQETISKLAEDTATVLNEATPQNGERGLNNAKAEQQPRQSKAQRKKGKGTQH